MQLKNINIPIKKPGIVATFCFTTFCFIAAYSICRVTSSFSLFWVKDLGVCQEIGPDNKPSAISDTFASDSERIYTFFSLDSAMPVTLKVRWYYEDQIILENQYLFEPGLNYSWITSHQGFKPGTYRVEVGDQTIEFKIEKSSDDAA